LIGMGILPIKIPPERHPRHLLLSAGDRIEIDARTLKPRGPIPILIHRASGEKQAFEAIVAVETSLEIALLQSGGVLPQILKRALADPSGPRTAAGHRRQA